MNSYAFDDRWKIASTFYKNKFKNIKLAKPDIVIEFPTVDEASKFADSYSQGINKEVNNYIIDVLRDDPVLYSRILTFTSQYTTGNRVKLTVL